MSPALTKRQRKRLLKKEKAIKHREDATRRQTERAREQKQKQKQKQKQTEKKLDADFQLDGKTLPGSGWWVGCYMGNWVIPVRALYKWSSSQQVSHKC